MKTIEIDEELFTFLQNKAETPNETLKRLLMGDGNTIAESEDVGTTGSRQRLGNLEESVGISLKRGNFRIDRYDTKRNRAYNLDKQKKESVTQLCKDTNTEKNLGVELYQKDGKGKLKDSQPMARAIMKALIDQKKNAKLEELPSLNIVIE